MRAWRICRIPHAADPLNGRGGLFTSGRWHTRGHRVVYTSESLALAALELLVHCDRDTIPSDLLQVEIEIPDKLKITQIDISALPKDWQSHPAPPALQHTGDQWLDGGSTAVLKVPSAVIPEECNMILNPDHSDIRKISVVSTGPFKYDTRLGS